MKKVSFLSLTYSIKISRTLIFIIVVVMTLVMMSGCIQDGRIQLTQARGEIEKEIEDVFEQNASNDADEELLTTSNPTVTPTPTPAPTATPVPTATPTPVPTATPTPVPTATPTPMSVDDVEGTFNNQYAQSVFTLVNAERQEQGLSPLIWDSNLESATNLRAKEIVILFSHTRPDGSSCFTVFPSGYSRQGENLAWGYSSAQSVMDGWMGSDGHRANILHADFTHICIASFESGGSYYWVQLFGTR